ncbi:unnamed protein product [Echinostoma caproni]|uniref:glycerol-3-phosphate dehydrogenase n=1 Tax=Echinostoma caproni TaxID=27848 RepID=A0A3P8KK24_9TREM|nr:unnamed protein product [Echinostoma caproni]
MARRTRLAFLNAIAAQEALPRIVELMAAELGWDKKKQQEELEHARKFLGVEMGFNLSSQDTVPLNLTLEETEVLLQRFRHADSGGKGYISLTDLERLCDESGQHLTKDSLKNLLRSMDLNKNGQIDMAEFLHFMSALKTGKIAHSPLKRVFSGTAIPVHRSGGGV